MNSPNTSPRRSIRHWIASVGWLALLALVLFQSRSLSLLRREVETLRTQAQTAPPETPSPPPAATAVPGGDQAQLQQYRQAFLQFSNEVWAFRQQMTAAANAAGAAAPQPGLSPVPPADAHAGEARQLVDAALQGDISALDKLAKLSAAVRTLKPEDQTAARASLQAAFEYLGTQAGGGNAASLQVLWQASRIRELQGYAVKGLGQAAGMGNEEALKPLLDPESYLLLRSSTTAALKPAADAGNERAIAALATTAADPKQQALWLMAAQGLETAATAGNATAIDGLITLAAAQNQVISKQAVLALEAAARNHQPRAEEALKKLGWR
jgi:hypothetical protein